MKKIKYLLLLLFAVFCCLGIAACKKDGSPKKLAAPQNLQMEGRTLVWDEDENATYYLVYYKYEQRTDEACFDLSDMLAPYTYEIEVMAVGDGKSYQDSDWVEFTYTPVEILDCGYDEIGFKYTLLDDKSGYEVSRGNLSYNDEKLRGLVEFPDYFCGLPVKKIAAEIFYSNAGYAIDTSKGYYCNTVTTGIKLPQKLETIGANAFSCCISIEEIYIPDTVATIEHGAFDLAIKLKKVNLPFGIKTIEDFTFYSTSITDIDIPDSVVSIGNSAFYGCKNLTSIKIPDSVVSIGYSVFSCCSSLMSITIPDSLTYINEGTFRRCNSIKSITIPDSVTYIGALTFEHSENLTEINFKGTKAQWEAIDKGSGWDKYTGNYTVHCMDGDIAKS